MDALQRQDGAKSVQTAAVKQAEMMIFDGILSFAIEQQVASCIRKPRLSLGNHPVICRWSDTNTIFLNLFRLDPNDIGTIQDDKNYTVWQKLMIFLHIVGHHVSHRNVSNHFRLSIAIINRIFNQVLVALADNLYDEFVAQPGPEYVSKHVELDLRNSDFNGLAMDNLKRLDSGDIAVRYMMSNNMEEDHELLPNCIVFVVLDGVGRKGQLTQNVFAAVKFDLKLLRNAIDH
ncbi:hypothetical protein E4U09_006371 [Claviceps aff. purpurea]|uniref:DUF8040 domain-containing protein n=1 Tax=Claviceps aff. purpurea TaxID=1967640 RepID=A0A9P7QKX8_9HYPO|nr:hypothetical protein E4U09_006371 [Claviceps aff. purpurea]